MSGKTESRRTNPATMIRVLAVVLAMLVVSAVTFQRSQSAFSGSTTYGANTSQRAGSVALTSGEAKAQTLDVGNLVPGDSFERCVDVTYTGSLVGPDLTQTKVYIQDGASGRPLASHLFVTADMGGAGSTCAGASTTWTRYVNNWTLQALSDGYSDYAGGLTPGWTPTATPETRAFRFTFRLDPNTPNDKQGAVAKTVITWEIRSRDGKVLS